MASSIILNLLFFLCVVTTAKPDAEPNHKQNRSVLVYNITCDSNSEEDCQDKSLETIAAKIDELNVKINIKIPELKLSASVSFTSLNSLIIDGISGLTHITCIAGNAGIVLKDVDKITLRNLNLTFCGHVGSERAYNGKKYSSALTIIHCEEVEINRLVIERSMGIGLMIIGHQGSIVNVSSSTFKENRLLHEHSSTLPSLTVWGGGGIYIEMKKAVNGSNWLTSDFQFHDCTFENNTANNSHYDYTYTDILGEVNEGFGRGGGVYVLLSSGLTNVSVSFIGCKFIANNAFLGGGLSVKIYGNGTSNIHILITNSVFERNGCNKHTAGFGGGAHLTLHTSLHNLSVTDSHYFLKNVIFIANCAELGGGIYHYSNRQDYQDIQNSNSMTFDDCTFKENEAHMGSAIIMAPDVNRRLSVGYSMIYTLLDCRFLDNTIYFNSPIQSQRTAGVGTVYISSYNVQFQGHSCFENNFGTALYVINAIINFQKSSATFSNNTGLLGGAVALIGSSTLILGRKSYNFVYNTAHYKGGGIYVSLTDNLDFIGSNDCFFQYVDDEGDIILSSEWKANITFTGNRAKDPTGGHAIYATSLRPCQLIKRLNRVLLNTSEVFTTRGFTFDDDEVAQIATDGAILKSTKPLPLMIIPGEKISHGVVVTDDLDKHINASFWATITEKSNGARLDSTAYSTLITDKIRVKGKPSQKLALDLNILSSRQTYINLDVELLDCPPGFELKDNSDCVCNLDGYTGLFKCDLDNFQSHLLPGYWVGYIDPSNLVTSVCPFCDYSATNASNTQVILPRLRSELDKAVCGSSRTGIVCAVGVEKTLLYTFTHKASCVNPR